MLKHVLYKSVTCCAIMVAGSLLACAQLKTSPAVTNPADSSVFGRTIGAGGPHIPVSRGRNSSMIEEFSFYIKDFKMNHQSEINVLNLTVRYRYVAAIPQPDYPDFRLVAKDLEGLLANYPNRIDYWEIVNKRLTQLVLDRYAAIQSVTIEMQVSPLSPASYTRASTVTRTRVDAPKNGRDRKQRSD